MFPAGGTEAPSGSGTPDPQSRAVTEAAAPAGLAGREEGDRVACGGSAAERGRGPAGGGFSVMLLDVAREAGMDLPEERVPSRSPALVHRRRGHGVRLAKSAQGHASQELDASRPLEDRRLRPGAPRGRS